MTLTSITDYVLGAAHPDEFVFRLNDAEKAQAIAKAQAISKSDYTNDSVASYVERLRQNSLFPQTLLERIRYFVDNGNSLAAYLIENLPLDDIKGFTKDGSTAELMLLAGALAVGTPYGYVNQRKGNVIQDLIPKKSDADKQLGTGSVELVWHTEDAHTELNCNYIGLLCLRGDPEAGTLVSCIKPEELDPSVRSELEKKQFTINSDDSHDSTTATKTSVLDFSDNHLHVRYDPLYTTCDTPEAQAALDALTKYINAHAVEVVLKTGDLLIIDNNCGVHARTQYHPRFDDTDRWIKRVAILTKPVSKEFLLADAPFVIQI